jgi:hypothetical protein
MTERLTSHEVSGEKLHLTDLAKENLKRVQEAAEQAEAHGSHNIEHLKQAVHEQAVSGHEYTVGEREAAPATHTFGAHKQLKAESYKRTLTHIRSKLSWSEKRLSKHVHRKKTEQLESIAARTVARPWGLLVGGLCAFTGSLFVLILAHRYGFRYNFSIFLILFLGGYLAGSLLEIVGRLIKKD